ncbi:cysteine hydrolase family protein [Bulleidia sp. zg-1006]|uniref:cysteine hydrolase family protein n=1 Tax=Bulleidia sp. zg-1006 TaxID=2806552 RepID=UPI001939FDC9|nr:isochorismatase family cysteine hydrolase [Bulleidia sp. zg-1006]QRG87227.1 cysteine hydrolase [Bulleidia sp. zg-1006]
MKRCLVVVDMQVDFVTGSLGTKEAPEILKVAKRIIQEPYDEIYVTMDTHDNQYLSSNEGRHLPVFHCVKDSPGWQLEASIAEELNKKSFIKIEKRQFGSFELVEALKKSQPDEVDFIGICTDICVLSNAILVKTALSESTISVYENATSATSPLLKEKSLEVLKINQVEIKEFPL